jgi:hypothetical protein
MATMPPPGCRAKAVIAASISGALCTGVVTASTLTPGATDSMERIYKSSEGRRLRTVNDGDPPTTPRWPYHDAYELKFATRLGNHKAVLSNPG